MYRILCNLKLIKPLNYNFKSLFPILLNIVFLQNVPILFRDSLFFFSLFIPRAFTSMFPIQSK